ncbi:MAG: hypothetical protein AAGB13_09770, partial [Cyanobacteria bacterium P01_F01_bin.33]
SIWMTNLKLKYHFDKHERQLSESSEQFWVVYWHSQWRSQPRSLAREHLVAYLQEPCFWAAYDFRITLESTPYSVIDFFQICFALEINSSNPEKRITLIDKILDKYLPETSKSLGSYAQISFKHALGKEIYRLTRIRQCSNWSLLCHKDVGDEVLRNALTREGFPEIAREQMRLMCECFRLFFDGKSPTARVWKQIAAAYNRTKSNYGTWPTLTAVDLEERLELCGRAIRSFYALSVKSLDAPVGGSECDSRTLEDSLVDPFEALSNIERLANRELWKEAEAILIQAFRELPRDKQMLLALKYGMSPKLDNYAIADRIGFEGSRTRKGNKVSQSIKSTKRKLARALAPWVENTLHAFATSPLDTMEGITKAIDLWLEEYSFTEQSAE